MANSRSVHIVRCTDPNNKKIWVDVKVLDKVSFKSPSNPAQESYGTKEITPLTGGPNVYEQLLDFSTGIVPYIKDNSGDGNGSGDPNNCTRVSHFERQTNPDDPSQFLDVEILDAIACTTTGGQEELLYFPASDAKAHVVDQTPDSAGLENDPGVDATRLETIIEIATTNDGTSTSTDKGIDPDGFDPDNNLPVPPMILLVQRTDKMAFKAPNGLEFVIEFDTQTVEEETETDTTRYTLNPVTGDLDVPPENSDPNKYIIFAPTDADSKKSGGPILGPKLSLKQGPLWRVIRTNTIPGPWYWYVTRQQPKNWGYFGTPPEDIGEWPAPFAGLRGFVLQAYGPVIWILSANSPAVPLDPIGYASLEDAIDHGSTSLLTSGPTIPNGSPPIDDFGEFDLLAGPISEQEIADNDTVPSIFQLTGIKQPVDLNGTPILPNAENREKIVTLFAKMWNDTVDAAWVQCETWRGVDFNSDLRPSSPPVWPFVIPNPWFSNFIAGHFSNFQAGLTVGLYAGGIPLEVLQSPATNIGIGQLDPYVWDTSSWPPRRR